MRLLNVVAISTLLFASLQSWALDIYRTGSPRNVSRPTQQVTCLAGGGSDASWGMGWKYLLENSGGGDVVIIRADGIRGGYENWIFKDESGLGLPRVNSVTTISLSQAKDANDPEVEQALEKAELIFFAGGDQALYISWFRHSKLEKAVERAIKIRRIPIAGTSAGMALLAGISFRARYNSPNSNHLMVTSEDALQGPTGVWNDLDTNSISARFLDNVITETHFGQRNRYGRIVGLMAKAVFAGLSTATNIKSISADQGTAFCYNSSGAGRVYGSEQVYFMRGLSQPEVLEEGLALTWDNNGKAIEVKVLKDGDEFKLPSWTSGDVFKTYWSVVDGMLIQSSGNKAE